MKKKLSLLLVMLFVFTMIISTTAVSVSAETTTYTPIGGSTSFVKNLVVDSNSNIPNITFSYTMRRGTGSAATADTIEILVSPTGGGVVGTASFSNADTPNTIPGLPSDDDPVNNPTEGKKYAQKEVTVTLPDTSFTKPGVYRYEITETNEGLPGVSYDTNAIRYLDVFVVADENDVLSVDSYVLRDSATAIGIDGKYTSEPDKKSAGYTNSITQYNFDFNKTISGNQGDKNKRFTFTLTVSGANPGTYPVIANDVTDNPTTITVPLSGTVSAEYQLTNGSSVQILGLNEGAVCNVEEDPDDYTPTYSIDEAGTVSGSICTVVLENSGHSVAFTNTRNGIIPTGVIIAIAPFAIGILVFGAVIVFIVIRRKRRPY